MNFFKSVNRRKSRKKPYILKPMEPVRTISGDAEMRDAIAVVLYGNRGVAKKPKPAKRKARRPSK